MPQRTLEECLRLPWRRVVERRVGDGGTAYYIASIREIPFIRIDGASREEALAYLNEILPECLEAMIQAGDEIPAPPAWPGEAIALDAELPLPASPRQVLRQAITPVAEVGAEMDDDARAEWLVVASV